jgi:hypothetical protein
MSVVDQETAAAERQRERVSSPNSLGGGKARSPVGRPCCFVEQVDDFRTGRRVAAHFLVAGYQ